MADCEMIDGMMEVDIDEQGSLTLRIVDAKGRHWEFAVDPPHARSIAIQILAAGFVRECREEARHG